MSTLFNKLACYFLLHEYVVLNHIGSRTVIKCARCQKVFVKEMG